MLHLDESERKSQVENASLRLEFPSFSQRLLSLSQTKCGAKVILTLGYCLLPIAPIYVKMTLATHLDESQRESQILKVVKTSLRGGIATLAIPLSCLNFFDNQVGL